MRVMVIVLACSLPLSTYGAAGPLYNSFQSKFQSYAAFTGAYVVIWPKQNPLFPAGQLESLKSIAGVRGVYGVIEGSIDLPLKGNLANALKKCGSPIQQVPGANLTYGLDIIGFNTSAASQLLIPYQLASGRFPFPDESAVAINQASSACNGIGVGDKVSGLDIYDGPVNESGLPVNPTKDYKTANVTLNVVGEYSAPPGSVGDAITDLTTVQQLFPELNGWYSLAWITVDSVQDVSIVAQEIQAALPGFNVSYPGTLVKTTTQLLGSAISTTSLMLDVSILVSVATILVVRVFDAQTRRRDFGLLESLGWTKSKVIEYELLGSALQGVLIGALATLLTVPLGNMVVSSTGLGGLVASFDISYYPDAFWYLTIVGLALVSSVASSLLIVWRILAKSPSGLLRG